MVLEPLARGIYDQDLDAMQAFSAIVSVTSLLGAASFDGGNSVLVERMLNRSGADVRLSNTVVEVIKNAPRPPPVGGGGVEVAAASPAPPSSWQADTQSTGFSINSLVNGHNDTSVIVDAVIIASPIEFTGIAFPPTVKIPPPRPFQHIWVTIVRAAGLDPAYFGLPAGTNVSFDNVLTTKESSASTPFVVVESEGEATATELLGLVIWQRLVRLWLRLVSG